MLAALGEEEERVLIGVIVSRRQGYGILRALVLLEILSRRRGLWPGKDDGNA